MTTASADVPPELKLVASVRALKAARRVSTEDLARLLGISRSTWFQKMGSGQFTVGEAATLAAINNGRSTSMSTLCRVVMPGVVVQGDPASAVRLALGDVARFAASHHGRVEGTGC